MLEPATPSRSLDSSVSLTRRTLPGMDHLPDLLLIERARSGDEHAIEALVRRYGRRLFRVARSVVPDPERAETVVLEAYLAAFGDLSRYEPTGKFAAWLTRLAYHQARALRGAARAVAAVSNGAAAGTEPEELQERRELEQAIGCLPEVFRTVFVLRIIEGISGIETAASLGVHETTVRTRLYRAHRRLSAETLRRVRLAPTLMDLAPARLEHLVARVLQQLPHPAPTASSAP